MSRKLWVVKGVEKSQDGWRVWPYYVLAESSLEAERSVRDHETRKFEAVIAQYVGEFKPKQVVAEWNGHGKDIVSDLREEGVADLFWWELVDGELKLCGVLNNRPRGVR
jgi:hypothetical protein